MRLELYNGELTNRIRKTTNIKNEIASLIEKSTYYLVNQLKPSGQFEYGYFSAFVRHASSLYSMAEGYELVKDEKILDAIERGIEYLIGEAIVYKNEGNQKLHMLWMMQITMK